jgi:hypothetical protein
MFLHVLLVISCAMLGPFLPLILSASHLYFNIGEGRVEEVEDSPYLIRQPHSLDDFLKQVDWVRELSELKASIRKQEVNYFFG